MSTPKPCLKAIHGGSAPARKGQEGELSDQEILTKIRSGDRDAYRLFVRKYEARAIQIAYGILKNQSDAEDVVQESFVKAFLSLENFRGDSGFYTWLYRIVYNMAIDLRRKLARREAKNTEFDESLLNSSSLDSSISGRLEGPGEALERKDKAGSIGQALLQISEEHRTVMILREVDGLSYEEIAELTKVNKGTVMSRLHYARKQLQKILEDIRYD